MTFLKVKTLVLLFVITFSSVPCHALDVEGLVPITISYFGGYASLSVLKPVVNRMSNVSKTVRTVISGCPPVFAGISRTFAGADTDAHGGKRAFAMLLAASTVGTVAIVIFNAVKDTSGLKAMTNDDWGELLLLGLAGALAGFGLGTYGPAMGMAAYSARTVDGKGMRQAVSGGIGNLGSGIASIVMAALLYASVEDYYAQAVWCLTSFVALVVCLLFLPNSPFHQYLDAGEDRQTAKEKAGAEWQVVFPPKDVSYFSAFKLDGATNMDICRLMAMCNAYIAVNGLSFAITTYSALFLKVRLGYSHPSSLMIGAMFSILSAIFRALAGVASDYDIVKNNTNIISYAILYAQVVGGIGLFLFGTHPAGLFIFAIIIALAQGVGKYSVLTWGGESLKNISSRPGVVAGYLGCFGSASSPFLSAAIGGLSELNTRDGQSAATGGYSHDNLSFEWLVVAGHALFAALVLHCTMGCRGKLDVLEDDNNAVPVVIAQQSPESPSQQELLATDQAVKSPSFSETSPQTGNEPFKDGTTDTVK